MLNPIFTIPHIRNLTPIFHEVAYQMRDALKSELAGTNDIIDMMAWLTRTSLEAIGQAGLGYSFGAMKGDSDAYVKATKDLTYGSFLLKHS